MGSHAPSKYLMEFFCSTAKFYGIDLEIDSSISIGGQQNCFSMETEFLIIWLSMVWFKVRFYCIFLTMRTFHDQNNPASVQWPEMKNCIKTFSFMKINRWRHKHLKGISRKQAYIWLKTVTWTSFMKTAFDLFVSLKEMLLPFLDKQFRFERKAI